MGHHHLNFHFHVPQIHFHHNHGHGKKELKDIPKGCLAITVGYGEEHQRFVIPVTYINHPLFMQLLKEAEEEYGFGHKGPIKIPCHIEEFRHVQGVIDKEAASHNHHNHNPWCFKA
ncbi:auxin-responsive protein SAUR32 [Nicotiana tabacum]|uniref:Auxin-responsive protein SAUR32 n=2 Tax=Nicotiana TaxID=4085 RepID=A0A1S4C3C9_TOBAC|nr:PREDICTED: auxin-induced protein X15-like [Nicotiana sylvestris]XP_016495558.1 PREDICTED: auxin-responsive protein SAUR32-like [Nicotiana tabacum]